MRNLNERIGNILLDMEFINAQQLGEAFRYQHTWGVRLGQALVDLGYVDGDVILDALSLQLGVEWVRLTGMEVPHYILRRVPEETAREVHALPLGLLRTGHLKVAMRDPTNLYQLEMLRQVSGLEIDPVLAGDKDIAGAISRHYDEPVYLRGEATPVRHLMEEDELDEVEPMGPITLISSLR